jgi:hypothetical protein
VIGQYIKTLDEGKCAASRATSARIILRVTVIGGKRWPDDFTVIWRGLPVGRIMLAPGMPPQRRLCSVARDQQKATITVRLNG